MKKRYLLLIVIIYIAFSVSSLDTIAQPGFQKYFSDLVEYQKLALSSFDKSYVMASSSRDEAGGYDFFVVKMDDKGKPIWSKTYPSPSDDYLTSLSISPTGEILLAGYKLDGDGDFDFSLMKLNASGNLQWYKTYGTSDLDITSFAGATSSGDIFICGNRNTDKLPLVIKMNSSGTVLWSKTFGTSLSDKATKALASAITKEGGIVVFGEYGYGNYLMKLNPDGEVAWANHHDAVSQFQDQSFMKQTGDGGFIVVGKMPYCVNNICTYNFSFMKLDQKGNVSWSKNVTKYESLGTSVAETSDGNFVFSGQLTDSTTHLIMIKTDSKGNHLFAKSYGKADSYGEYAGIEQAPDGGAFLLGVENVNAFLIKTDLNGITGCNEKKMNLVLDNISIPKSSAITIPEFKDSIKMGAPVCAETLMILKDSLLCNPISGIEKIQAASKCTIHPNPFMESITVDILSENESHGNFKFIMYDVFGKKVMELPVNNHRLVITRGTLTSGMYFYNVFNEERVVGNGKIIAQ